MLNTELCSISVLCITEHWLNIDQIISFSLPGFSLANYFCRNRYKNGGSLIFIKQGLQYKSINKFQHLNADMDFELALIELSDINTIIACIYHFPKGNFDSFLNKLEYVLNGIHLNKKLIVLCGDFNVDFLETGNRKLLLLNLTDTFNLRQIIKTPTTITKTSPIALEPIFVNTNCTSKCMSTHLGDHKAQLVTLPVNLIPSKNSKRTEIARNFNSNNIEKFNYLLSKERWGKVLQIDDTNQKFNKFSSTFTEYFETAFPLERLAIRDKSTKTKGWITAGIRILSERKRQLLKYQKTTTYPLLWQITYKSTLKSIEW